MTERDMERLSPSLFFWFTIASNCEADEQIHPFADARSFARQPVPGASEGACQKAEYREAGGHCCPKAASPKSIRVECSQFGGGPAATRSARSFAGAELSCQRSCHGAAREGEIDGQGRRSHRGGNHHH